AAYTYNTEGGMVDEYFSAPSLIYPNTIQHYTTAYEDPMWRPTRLIDQNAQPAQNVVQNTTYGPASELTQVSYLNPASNQYVIEYRSYNNRLQLTEINVPTYMDMVYTYPGAGVNNGRIAKQKDNVT